MSFRQYGGINYAARNNIVKNNYTNANNLSVMTKVGQPSSIINVESGLYGIAGDITFQQLGIPKYGIMFSDGSFQNTAVTSTDSYWVEYLPPTSPATIYYTGRAIVGADPYVTGGSISSDVRLAVNGGTAIHGNLYVANGDSSNSGIIYVTDNSNNTLSEATLRIVADRGNKANYIQSGKNNVTGSVADLYFTGMNATGTIWMTIKADGKVGIGTGTATPNEKLDVRGNVYIEPTVTTTMSNPAFKIELTNSNCIIYEGTTPNDTVIQNNGSGSLKLMSDIGDGVYISGNSAFVGINNTNPTYTLDVTGTLNVSQDALIHGLTVGQGGGSVSTNTVVGIDALKLNTTGNNNTAVGYASMRNNTASSQNTSLGINALYTQQNSGTSNGAGGWINNFGDNTAIGLAALYWNNGSGSDPSGNLSGAWNTAVGLNALYFNTTGYYNTAIGLQAGVYFNNSEPNGGGPRTANKCTFLGAESRSNYSSPIQSTAIGYNSVITANNQIMMGTNSETVYIPGKLTVVFDASINNLTVGKGGGSVSSNTAVGFDALKLNTSSGTYNTAIGYQSLYSDVSGNSNTALGYQSLYSDQYGNNNTAIGYQALYSYNTTETIVPGNTAIGYQALFSNVYGTRCTAVGHEASKYQTGVSNTSLGFRALFGTSGTSTGTNNCAFGDSALEDNTNGFNNVAIGHFSLLNNTTGSNNTAVGSDTCVSPTNCTNCTFIGSGATTGGNNYSNSTALGNGAIINANNQIILGNSSIISLQCKVALTVTSDARDKTNFVPLDAGLNFINVLNPVRFDWNQRGGGLEGRKDVGFTAQELLSAQEKTKIPIPNLVDESNPDKYHVMYTQLIPILVKAVQEMSSTITRLECEINELKLKI